METQFITLQLPTQASPGATRRAIETALSERGQPLRWAITALDKATAMATVEAIVTAASLTTAPTT
ncbi:MAG: hypothetical protein HC824_08085 [Synechococcales cyanobacterium RM1_1_8]|nr:hypothetical protein [Synechococcales cyanobacterium RM1_1_8]